MSSRDVLFSIVVPVYQNQKDLEELVQEFDRLSHEIPGEMEFIFVDDGSTDQSFEVLKKQYDQDPQRIKILRFTKNFGQICGIQAGLREARGRCVGIISADLQDPPQLFAEMFNEWKNGAKLVLAEREDREDGWLNNFFANAYWGMVKRFALKGYPRGGFDFCLLDRELVNRVNESQEKNTQIFPLIFSFGYPYRKIFYKRQKRKSGKSQYTLSKKLKLFTDTFVAFSYAPIKGISYLGLVVSFLAFGYALLMLFGYFFWENHITGWTTLVVLVSALGGLILMTLGIIGEYTWRILEEVRKRPPYVVLEKYSSSQSDGDDAS